MKGSKGVSRFFAVIVLGSLAWWLFSNALYEFRIFEEGSKIEEVSQNQNVVDSQSVKQDVNKDEIDSDKVIEQGKIKPVIVPSEVLPVDSPVAETVQIVIPEPIEDLKEETVSDILDKIALELEHVIEATQDIVLQINTPEPLVTEYTSTNSLDLTQSGVLYYTNEERTDRGLVALGTNNDLNRVAEMKVDDMFVRQYFEHESPTGVDVSGLVNLVSYEYISVGENLAMGNFESDRELVTGWMNSPGHRENILGEQYTEIGISVKEGMYDGHKIWMAVQTFGRPLSDCSTVDEDLASRIEVTKVILEATSVLIDSMRTNIENYYPKRGYEYNTLVDEFNLLVEGYNSSSLDLKSLVEKYNLQVNEFNICIVE